MKPLDFEHYEHITQNVCLDAGYVGKADVASRHGMVPHIRPRGEEKKAIELHGFRPNDGLSRLHIRGSTDSEKFMSDTKKPPAHTMPCCTWQL